MKPKRILFSAMIPLLLTGFARDPQVNPLPSLPSHPAEIQVEKNIFYAPMVTEIPFELVGKLIVVRAEVDGKSGNFILDTGAPDLLLNRSHFQGEDREATFASGGATGPVEGVGVVYMEQFSWEGVRVEKRQVETVPLGHVENTLSRKILGLIGRRILQNFEVKLDYARQVVTLYRLNAFGAREFRAPGLAPLQSVPLLTESYVPILRHRVGGKKLRFALDTGASANLLDHRVHERSLAGFIPGDPAKLYGTGKRRQNVLAGTMQGFELAGHQYQQMRTVVADISDLERAYKEELHGVLGYEFFKQHVVSINYARGELNFWN